MEASSITKVGGVSLGGVVVIGATSYGAYSLVQPKTMEEKILWNNGVLLGKDDLDIWKENVKKYESIEHTLDTTNFIGTTEEQKIEELKEKCRKALNEPLTNNETDNDNRIHEISRWCVKVEPVY